MLSPPIALLRTQSDERLVALAQAGHERAFEAIVERYRRPLLRSCRRILPDSRAEDAVQQAFLTAWRALRRGDDVRELGAWLHTILKTSALQNLRVRAYEYDELRDSLEYGNTPEEEFERRSVMRATLAGLATLPDNQREALLRTAVGERQEDIAHEMGLSHGAVRQLVHRARLQLRAAATAITPLPLAVWLANVSGSRTVAPVTERIGELVAGAGTAGVAATVAKAGAVVVVAGSAVTAASPEIAHHIADPLNGVKRVVTERPDSDDARGGTGGAPLAFAGSRAVPQSSRGDGVAGLLTGSAGPVRLVARLGVGGTLFDSIGHSSSPTTSTPTFASGDPAPTLTDGTPVAVVNPGSTTTSQPAKETPKDERPADDVVFDDVGPADTQPTSDQPSTEPTPTDSTPATETPTTTDPPADPTPADPTPTETPAATPTDGGNASGDPPGSDPGGGIAQPGENANPGSGNGNGNGKPADEVTPSPTPEPDPTPSSVAGQ